MKRLIVIILLFVISPAFAIPGNINNQIKADAKLEWPNDYQMQAYEIKNQSNAYTSLDKLFRKGYKGVPFNIVRDILKRSKKKWDRDYQMQLYETNNQIESYIDIN